MKEKFLEINEEKGNIKHLIPTKSGQSGCPIIKVDGEEMSIVGVHKGGVRDFIKRILNRRI